MCFCGIFSSFMFHAREQYSQVFVVWIKKVQIYKYVEKGERKHFVIGT